MIGKGLRFALVLFVGMWLTASVSAQDRSVRGTVTAIGGDSITVKAADGELKFTVDAKTVLTAPGAGTADRRAEAAGKPGPRVADFVKAGDAVEVSYTQTGSTMHASNIRRVTGAGGGGSGSVSSERAETANGTVDSITATTLVISGKASGGSFKQTFAIDASTKVIAAGASTAAAASKGGKIVLSEFVGAGDQVTVSYRKAGNTIHADEVHVRSKGKK